MTKPERARPPLKKGPRIPTQLALAAVGIALAVLHPSPSLAQDIKEHPVVKLYPGAEVEASEQKAFDAARMVVRRQGAALPLEEIEGRVTPYTFTHPAGTSPVQVVRNFENALREAGFATVAVAADFDIDNGLHDRLGAFKLERAGQDRVYGNVLSSANGEGARSEVTVVDVKAMEQVYVVNADSLYAALQASGRVTLEGVTFETGKTTLRPDSVGVLGEARKLLIAHPLSIEGHTDDVGAAAANQALSAARADAEGWLTSAGINSARLKTAWFGPARPLAPTRTKRVERRTGVSNWCGGDCAGPGRLWVPPSRRPPFGLGERSSAPLRRAKGAEGWGSAPPHFPSGGPARPRASAPLPYPRPAETSCG